MGIKTPHPLNGRKDIILVLYPIFRTAVQKTGVKKETKCPSPLDRGDELGVGHLAHHTRNLECERYYRPTAPSKGPKALEHGMWNTSAW